MESLRARISAKPIVVAPGVYDAFTALIATQAGIKKLYVSGAAIAYCRLGRPDIGLVTETELEETLSRITERVATPVIVDADALAVVKEALAEVKPFFDTIVSISIGVATLSEHRDGSELLASADDAMYAAKEGGRDRVVRADTLQEAPPHLATQL